ncbi:hypothetical protein H257_04523, partial [Aphanomyces astaci]
PPCSNPWRCSPLPPPPMATCTWPSTRTLSRRRRLRMLPPSPPTAMLLIITYP